jgi:hypothetical protein
MSHSKPQLARTYGNILPLAECKCEMDTRHRIDNPSWGCHPSSAQYRLQWLAKTKNATQSEFIELRKQRPNNFYYTHACLLALQDEALFQRWLELEQLLSERQLIYFKSELKRVCDYYGIDLARNRSSFKFPHQEQAVPTNDVNICRDLAKHGFPNVRIPIAGHHPHDLPVIREYARVLEPEERIHVAVMVPVQLLEGTRSFPQ